MHRSVRGWRDAGLWLRDGRRRRRLSAGQAADYDRAMERSLERRGPATGAAWELHDGVVLVAADGETRFPGAAIGRSVSRRTC